MFLLFYLIHFLKFGGKSQPQRFYKNGSYKIKKSVCAAVKGMVFSVFTLE